MVGEASISMNWSGKGQSGYLRSDRWWSDKRRSASKISNSQKILILYIFYPVNHVNAKKRKHKKNICRSAKCV